MNTCMFCIFITILSQIKYSNVYKHYRNRLVFVLKGVLKPTYEECDVKSCIYKIHSKVFLLFVLTVKFWK